MITPDNILKLWNVFPAPNGTISFEYKANEVAALSVGIDGFSYAAMKDGEDPIMDELDFDAVKASDALAKMSHLFINKILSCLKNCLMSMKQSTAPRKVDTKNFLFRLSFLNIYIQDFFRANWFTKVDILNQFWQFSWMKIYTLDTALSFKITMKHQK